MIKDRQFEQGIYSFQKYYKLGKNRINESLLHFTGGNNMNYYIPIKPYKSGFKIHLLYDFDNYTYIIYFFFVPKIFFLKIIKVYMNS